MKINICILDQNQLNMFNPLDSENLNRHDISTTPQVVFEKQNHFKVYLTENEYYLAIFKNQDNLAFRYQLTNEQRIKADTLGQEYIESLALDIENNPLKYVKVLQTLTQNITRRDAFYLEEDNTYFVQKEHTTSFIEDLKYIISLYSSGMNKSALKEKVAALEPSVYEGFEFDLMDDEHYYFACTALSLFRLFDLHEKFDTFKHIIPFETDRLLHWITSDELDFNYNLMLGPTYPYIYVIQFIKNDLNTSFVDDFLRHFYPSKMTIEWYDSHIHQHENYFGYWSFLLAVIVSKMDLDDLAFIDHMFYPRDLIGKRPLLPTWEDSQNGEQARILKSFLQKVKAKGPRWSVHQQDNIIVRTIPKIFDELWQNFSSQAISKNFLHEIDNLFEINTQDVNQYKDPNKLKKLFVQLVDSIQKVDIDTEALKKMVDKEALEAEIKKHLQQANVGDLHMIDDEITAFLKSGVLEEKSEFSLHGIKTMSAEIAKLNESFEAEDTEYWDQLHDTLNKYGWYERINEDETDERIAKIIDSERR